MHTLLSIHADQVLLRFPALAAIYLKPPQAACIANLDATYTTPQTRAQQKQGPDSKLSVCAWPRQQMLYSEHGIGR
jgi:hypothetical protein